MTAVAGLRLARRRWLGPWAVVWALAGPAGAAEPDAALQPPPAQRPPVELERELAAPWQAGGEIRVELGPDGLPRAGRHPAPPASAAEEQARRAEHFALARRFNMQSPPRSLPLAARPLGEAEIGLLERFALSDAGAVWFREVADDTLRLFNQGYLEVDPASWRGFRCNFLFGGEPVDPLAILSQEFGHTRYGDPRSAGLPLGEARTVARYENPVRLRNGFPPRTIYYLRVEPGRTATTRDPLFARVLAWRQEKAPRMADLDPVVGLYRECPGSPDTLRDCLARAPAESAAPDAGDCGLRWVAVRVDSPEPPAGDRP